MELINEGAEATIYSTEIAGIAAVLKRRISKDYRIKEIDSRIRDTRSRTEARIIAHAARSGIRSPKLLLSDKYDIYMTRLDGERLDSYMKKNGANTKVFKSVGELLAQLHNANISHGDFTPANILVSNQEAYVMDFGLAQISDSIEPKAIDLLLIKRATRRKDYKTLLTSYQKVCKKSKEILNRLEVIEKRGRYNTRTIKT